MIDGGLNDFFLKKLNMVFDSGKPWMAAVWSIDGGSILLDRVTSEFPTDQFEKSIHLLRENLKQEMDDGEPEPLPLATHLKINSREDGQESLKEINVEGIGNQIS